MLIQQLAIDPDTDTASADPTGDEGPPTWSVTDDGTPPDTVRSLAYDAAIGYALWSVTVDEAASSPRQMPQEVRVLIAGALDPATESSAAVRATLTKKLPTLLWIDERWVASQLGAVFASEPQGLADAAWCGFLGTDPVPVPVLQIVLETGAYETAVHVTGNPERFAPKRDEQLGHQLLLAAVFELDGYQQPWQAWMSRASPDLRATVIERLGRHLRGSPSEDVAPLADALAARWAERLQALPAEDKELAAFGSWFGTDLVAPERAVELLLATLARSGGAISGVYILLTVAAGIARSHPASIVSLLRHLSRGPSADQLTWHRDQVRSILAAVNDSTNATAQADAQQLIGELAERGLGDFRP